MPRRWLDFLYTHRSLTFVLMVAFFLLFGITSVNLFVLLKMNIDLFIEYGLMVVADGALEQLVDLIASAALSIVFYLVFKVCERVLVERLTEKKFGAGGPTPRLPLPREPLTPSPSPRGRGEIDSAPAARE